MTVQPCQMRTSTSTIAVRVMKREEPGNKGNKALHEYFTDYKVNYTIGLHTQETTRTCQLSGDNEIHNSIPAAFEQNCHTSAQIPNITGMVCQTSSE